MRRLTPILSATLVVAALAGAQTLPAQGAATTQKLEWGPGPPGLPPGAKLAVVEGDPTKSGPFTIHLLLPNRYRVPPHSHPTDEKITVVRGTFRYGMGDTWDTKSMQALTRGASETMKAGENHYVRAVGRTEIAIQSTGPFEITYADPKDDPRNKKGKKPKA